MSIRRIISLILVASLCLLSFSALAGEKTYESDKNLVYYELLSKLDIMPSYLAEKNPSENITRGEFSHLAAAAFGYPTNGGQRYFTDIDYSKEYSGSVSSLRSAGIVSGNAQGNFYPEEDITMADASVVAVRLLGYGVMADSLGGYPSGYLAAATKLGIFNGIGGGAYITVSDAVRMIFNAMTVDRMENNGFSGKDKYSVVENSSELLARYDLKYAYGVVEKNKITSLESPQGFKTMAVQIDGVKYADPDGLAQALLGYSTDILYYEEEGGRKTIFLAYASDDNTTLRIEAKDIYKDTYGNLRYDVNGKSKNLVIDFNIDVIYNGISAPAINGLDFIPSYGDILLVDNTGDNKYDTVFVNAYENYVVSVATEDSLIDINNEDILNKTADANGTIERYEDEDIAVYKDGVEIKLEDIATDSVVSVCRSAGEETIVIYVSENVCTGVLSSVSEEECVIGEKTYTFSPELLKDIADGTIILPPLGEEVVAYIDIKGNVVYFEEALFNGMAYGYVVGIKVASGFEDTVLRVINHLGKVDDLTIKDDVLVNQTAPKLKADELVPFFKDGNKILHQLIKYRKSGSNMLKEVSFEETGDITDEKRLVLKADYRTTKKYWRPSARSFDGLTPVTDDTVFFSVPTDDGDKANADKYGVSNYTCLQNDLLYGYKAYDAREAGVVSVIVVEGGKSSTFDPETTISIISNMRKTLNVNGEDVLSIQYMLGGTMRQALTDYSITYGPDVRNVIPVSWQGKTDVQAVSLYNTPDGLGEGDVVFISTSAEGTIQGIYKIADASKAPDMMDGYRNPSAESYKAYQTTYGKVVGMNKTIYTVLPEGKTDIADAIPLSAHYTATRYVYVDLNEKDIKAVKVNVDYLKRCVNNDNYRVFTRRGNAAVLDCVIYKLKNN